MKSPFMPYEGIFASDNIRSTLVTQSLFEKIFGSNCKTVIFYLGFRTGIEEALDRSGSIEDSNTIKNSQLKSKVDLQYETIAYSHGGKYAQQISFDSVESYEEILKVLNKTITRTDNRKGSRVKPSFRKLMMLGLLKDSIQFVKIFCVTSIILIPLMLMIYLITPQGVFVKIMEFYFPHIVLIVFSVFLLSASSPRIATGLISPLYQIVGKSLVISPRSIKLISDPPLEEIELSRVKKIWRIKNFIDGSSSDTFLLAVELNDKNSRVNKFANNSNKISRILGMLGSGALSFKLLYSIPSENKFIEQLSKVREIGDLGGGPIRKFLVFSFFF